MLSIKMHRHYWKVIVEALEKVDREDMEDAFPYLRCDLKKIVEDSPASTEVAVVDPDQLGYLP